jgi:hypothetical protein
MSSSDLQSSGRAMGFNGGVNAMIMDGSGNLYAGGPFTCAGGSTSSGEYPSNSCSGSGGTAVFNTIAKWNGSAWSSLGLGLGAVYHRGLQGGSVLFSIISDVYAIALDGAGNLYAGGNFEYAGALQSNSVAKWNGSAWSAPGIGTNAIYAMMVDSSETLYAGGEFTTMGGVLTPGIAKWNGSVWSAITSGIAAVGAYPIIAIDHAGNLYAAGQSYNHNSRSDVFKWNGSAWSILGGGFNGGITRLVVDGSGNVYVGGLFTCAKGSFSAGSYPANTCAGTGGTTVYNGVAKWNGSSWSGLGSGVKGVLVGSLRADSLGNVYVGGLINAAGGVSVNNVAKWNGSSWSALGSGIGGSAFTTSFFSDSTGNLYVGGSFSTAGGVSVNNIAKWNGSAWSALGSGFNGSVLLLAMDSSGNLYAGGDFTCAGGSTSSGTYPTNTCAGTGGTTVFNGVAKWNGSSWSALGSGSPTGVVSLVLDASGNLYAGGNFSTIGGVAANGIAKWDGSSWSALGSGVMKANAMASGIESMGFDNAQNLIVCGEFDTAGSLFRPNIAKWLPVFNSWF